MKIIFYGPVNKKLQRRNNYLLFHTLWSQKSICRIMWCKNASFQEITVMYDRKYLNCDI